MLMNKESSKESRHFFGFLYDQISWSIYSIPISPSAFVGFLMGFELVSVVRVGVGVGVSGGLAVFPDLVPHLPSLGPWWRGGLDRFGGLVPSRASL